MCRIELPTRLRIMAETRELGLTRFFGGPGGGVPLDQIEAGRRLGIDFIPVAHGIAP